MQRRKQREKRKQEKTDLDVLLSVLVMSSVDSQRELAKP